MKYADLLLKNGRFITMERPGEIVGAVAIIDDKILFVGSEQDAKQFIDTDTKVIDLGGKVAAPGLIDCHTHPMASYSHRFTCVNLRGATTASLSNMLEAIRNKAKETPKGEWIIARGFDESKFADGPVMITAKILDQATTEHPVFMSRTCGHIAVLNSAGMERSGFTNAVEDPSTGGHFFRDEAGNLTGMISGSVMNKVSLPSPTDEQKEKAMIDGVQAEYFRKGITATGEMGSIARTFRFVQKLDQAGKLKLRIGYYFSGRRNPPNETKANILTEAGMIPGFGTKHYKFLGIKFVMDGSTGGRTAAFSLPYQNEPENFGELYNDQDVLNEDMLKSARAGIQISIHAIGDRAIEGALKAVEHVKENGIDTRALRIRFEHLESPTADQIRRIKELGISVGLSSAFIYHLGDSHLNALGYDRLVDAFPAKTLIEQGITVACNTDCPVCDVNPMYGIYSMVNRITEAGESFGGKKEAIDRMQALESYTKNGAYLLMQEDMLGTLKAGKYADIVVFEQDFLNVADEELKDIQIHMTISGGEIVYQNK